MERVLWIFFLMVGVLAAFMAAFILTPWFSVEITLPAKGVGTVAGVFVFFIALIFLTAFFNLVSDILFYRNPRSILWMLIAEGWYDWRFILPVGIVTGVFCYLFSALFGVAIGAFVLVIFVTIAYSYVKIGVMNSIGNAFYGNHD
jgi:hypothetical protein